MNPIERRVVERFNKRYGAALAALFSRKVDMTDGQRLLLNRRLIKAFQVEYDNQVELASRRGPGRQPQVVASSF